MKKFISKYFLLGLALVPFLQFCNDDSSFREPSGSSSGTPQPVSEVQVKNLPGKATIKYLVPTNRNVLYVKAEYTLPNGKDMEIKASYFVDSVVVEGFAD